MFSETGFHISPRHIHNSAKPLISSDLGTNSDHPALNVGKLDAFNIYMQFVSTQLERAKCMEIVINN